MEIGRTVTATLTSLFTFDFFALNHGTSLTHQPFASSDSLVLPRRQKDLAAHQRFRAPQRSTHFTCYNHIKLQLLSNQYFKFTTFKPYTLQPHTRRPKCKAQKSLAPPKTPPTTQKSSPPPKAKLCRFSPQRS